MTRPYFRPPADYEPPTRCDQCSEMIFIGPVIGGIVWQHLNAPYDHPVRIDRPWWNTYTGEWVEGNPLLAVSVEPTP